MNFSYHIAKRYLYSKSSRNAINIITYIAIIGVIVGAASLFIVLSGFDGLKNFTLEFSTLIDPDLKASPIKGKTFTLSEDTEQQIKAIEDIEAYSKIIEERVLMSFDNNNHTGILKGVDRNYSRVNSVDSILYNGTWLTPGTNQVVSGWGISNKLNMGVLNFGKRLTLYVPKAGKGQIKSVKEAFNAVTAINIGIFDINENLNNSHLFSSIEFARDLLNLKNNAVSSLEFKFKKGAKEKEVRQKLQAVLGDNITFKNREQLNDALYKMLKTENLAVYLIFTLVLIIALFNIIGSLIMMILDKKGNLKTLFNIGATVNQIRHIFFLQGALMTVIGGIIGIVIGFIVVVLQDNYALLLITPSIAYPVDLSLKNVIIVFLTISILGVIASKIASVRITKELIEVN